MAVTMSVRASAVAIAALLGAGLHAPQGQSSMTLPVFLATEQLQKK